MTRDTIEVTKDCIEQGKAARDRAMASIFCPIGQAFMAKGFDPSIGTTTWSAKIDHQFVGGILPPKAQNFINHFDHCEYELLEPFSFDIEY